VAVPEADKRYGSSKPSETSEPAQNNEPSKGDERDERSETDESAKSGGSESDERSGGSKPSEQAQRSEDDERSKLSEKSKSDKQSGGPSGKGERQKEEWTGRYMYLPDEIDEQFDEFDRLVYECGQELDWKPKKNKHFYPVVVSQGIVAVAEMGASEFVDAVGDLELPRDR